MGVASAEAAAGIAASLAARVAAGPRAVGFDFTNRCTADGAGGQLASSPAHHVTW